MSLTPAELRVHGLDLGLTTTRATLLAELPTPERRRAAAEDHAARRTALALYRDLLVERDGNAPTLARLEAADDLLVELAVLTVA